MTNNSPAFDLAGADALKAAFRNHASGISVITALDVQGNPIGFTASSATSLGSNPPLVSLNVAQGSSSYPHLLPGRFIALHTLDSESLLLAQRFAGDKEGRFVGDELEGPEGLPIVPQASSVLIGKIREKYEIESNAVVIIDALSASVMRTPEEPLVYFQRAYHAIGNKLADNS